MKVLVLAELCNPNWASVPLVGWKHVKHLSHFTNLTLVTHEQNKVDIDGYSNKKFVVKYIKTGVFDRLYQYIVQRFFAGEFGSATLTFVKIPFYFVFEVLVAAYILRHFRKEGWQVIHRITPVSPVIASPIAFLARIVGIPFVLGPINGGLPWPPGYEHAAKEKSLLSYVRDIYRYDPLIQGTRFVSSYILVGSQHTMREMAGFYKQRCIYYPENGIETESVIDLRSIPYSKDIIKAIFVGRLVPLKCPHISILSSQRFITAGQMTLDIFGDGPERQNLEGILPHEGVTFHGWISSQKDLVNRLPEFDILIFPSIKEFGGGVVIEAMAKGVVPIVMDYGGPGEIVTDSSGFRIPIANESQTIKDIENLLEKIVNQPSMLASYSKQSTKRIRDVYTWEAKAKFIADIYRKT